MSGGNGVDSGKMFGMLRELVEGQAVLRAEQAAMRGDMAAMRGDITGMRGEITGVRSDIAALRDGQDGLHEDIAALRADHGRRLDDLSHQVAAARQDVAGYHASMFGHGILISESDARLRRVEAHLELPPAA